MRETVGATYYRARPLEAVRYAKSKVDLRGRACTSDAIVRRLGLDVLRSRRGLDRWADDLDNMLHATVEVSATGDDQGSVSLEGALLQYAVVRCLEPDLVIETGVAAGVSSAFILAALAETGKGRLISIDLPPSPVKLADGADYDWRQRGVGWAIPQSLRDAVGDRHTLVLEDVRTALPRVLEHEAVVDVFVHDDLHTPDHMRWEFDLVWPRLRAGGVMMADDVNQGWLGFADTIGQHEQGLLNVQRFGALRKPPAA
jgi:predicted O-methyltransferase YrrM